MSEVGVLHYHRLYMNYDIQFRDQHGRAGDDGVDIYGEY